MSDNPSAEAGPSSQPESGGADAALLRQFVMEYLQSHGFERALQIIQAGIKDQSGPGGGGGETEEAQGGREAIIRAPQPVPIESTLKRNIPQAQTVSASTLSERITPEFEAQARYIIEQLQRKSEAAATDEAMEAEGDAADRPRQTGEGVLDPSERVEGYGRYRRWVDQGLDLWKAELDGVSFPLFVHTFLDLLNFGFKRSARVFFDSNRKPHEALHSTEIASLAGISSKLQIRNHPLSQRLLNNKYTVPLSRNSHDLLLQWLSGAGLDEDWEAGLHTTAGRAKEAVKGIVFNRIKITVSHSPMPLDKITLASSSGLLSSYIPPTADLDTFNTSTALKLGPPPKTEKLKEQVVRTLQDTESSGANGTATGENGDRDAAGSNDGAADANGDIDMTQPIMKEIEPDLDADTLSPEPGETFPPVPAVFRTADLKREVEAVRDKRRMIRSGPGANIGKSVLPTTVLPSVVAFTMYDGGEGVSSVEFSQDSSLMAVGSPESCIRLWSVKGEKLKAKSMDPSTGDILEDEGLAHRKLIGHSGPVYSLSFDPIYGTAQSPSSLLSSSQDGTIRLWSMDTYSNLVVYRGHGRDPVWDVEWGPMGVYFASASRDRTARLWSSDRVTPLRMYTGHLSDVNCVKFHPNSLYLATGSSDNSCRLWDVQRGACIRLFLGHTDAVTTMAISPDGKVLASAGVDRDIWLWDLGSSRPIKKMSGHRAPIHSLSFSAESSVLVSGSADCTVRCWNVKSAGGERARGEGADGRRGGGVDLAGTGRVPMGPGEGWDEGATSDLLSTFHTKRTPILKAHYTPRNLCMVAGVFVPPSNTTNITTAAV